MGEWKREKLGGIEKVKIRKGDGLTSAKMVSGEYPVIAGGMGYCGTHNRFNRTENTITVSASGANAGTVLFHKTKIFATDCSTIEWGGSEAFLYYSLARRQKEFTAMQSGLAQPHVYPKDIEKFVLYYPTLLNEQRRIADILTSADEAIAASRALVEKYTAIKLGLMRDLLGRGEKVSLRKLGGRFIRGQGITRAEVQDEGVACIRYGELYTTYNIYINVPKSHVSVEQAKRCFHIKHGDLLFTLSGETAEEIGKTVVYLGDEECVVGGDIAVFTGHKQNPLYLSYILNAPDALKQKELMSTGSMVVHINNKKLEKISIPLPPLSEQQRIANILTSADTSLTSERKHLQKLENIKRGLMDDLLTNKVSTNSILHRNRGR